MPSRPVVPSRPIAHRRALPVLAMLPVVEVAAHMREAMRKIVPHVRQKLAIGLPVSTR